MKTILKIMVFLSSGLLNAQEHFKFYLEIPNSTVVPEVSYRKGGTLTLSFINNDLNNLVSSYNIYKFEKAFPTAVTPRLQSMYYVECDDISLKNTLLQNYSIYFPYAEQIFQPELMYTPSDYNYPGTSDPLKNLELINIREAWDYTHGDPEFKIGISDTPIRSTHEDLTGKITSLISYTTPDSHGTAVASHAAANTDNALGIPGTGFNSGVLYNTIGYNQLLELSQNGARVVNASWGYCNSPSQTVQLIMDEIHNNGTVIVASAGNGTRPCSSYLEYVYPASFDHVISVSSVGHLDVGYTYNNIPMLWRDRVEQGIGDPTSTHQLNDKVDLFAAGFNILGANADSDSSYSGAWGTSISAPQVSGVVALLFAANNCLNPDEVESLLKLTSADLELIPENSPYLGKMGAGRIDAGKATKAAWQMNSDNGGEVLLENRTFNRWHFELLNSPEYIRLKNEGFVENSDIVFRAKKAITLDVNTLLKPGTGKSHLLYAENTDTCSNFNKSYNPSGGKKGKSPDAVIKTSSLKLYPNPSKDDINIQTDEDIQRVEIFDTSGKLLKTGYSKKISVQELPKGNYLIKVYNRRNVDTSKFTKD